MERALVLKKQRDGRLLAVIGDLPCYTPAVPTAPEGFLNGSVTKRKDQRWARNFPSEEEIEAMPEHEQDALRAREAGRLLDGGGAWFLNDGEPTYLTPDHYFFLTHFQLPNGDYAEFREADVKDFMWSVAVSEDEQCIGGIFMGARQRGKTARRAARHLRVAMTTPGVHLGIQSKTDDDAKEILNGYISHALREMSALIKPVTSLSTDDAQTQIAFKAPARRGKAGQAAKKVKALNSRINRKNSKANAYDGRTLYEVLSDEWAKKQEYDTEERMTVISRMMWRKGKRIGRIWMPSTIDEKDDFEVEMPRRIWDNSNPTQRNPNGRTKTGLVRLFISTHEGNILDDYGRSDLAASIADWELNAPDKDSDPIGYRRYCRANPRDPEDGFASANRDSTFNLDNLDAARDANTAYFNKHGRYRWVQADLVWEDEVERTRVKVSPNGKNGRFKLIEQALPVDRNAVLACGTHTSMYGTFTKYKPLHEARNVVGCDPYNARKVANLGAASKAAAYAFWKPDELHERERFDAIGKEVFGYWPSDSFFVEYIGRPPTPDIFFEDMVKLCHLLGAPILIENNKDALLAYFEDRGYGDFMAGKISIVASENNKLDKKKKKGDVTPGMAAATGTTEQWAERISSFTHGPLGQDYRRMPFLEQIKSVTDLNIKDTQKYDAAVATGWTLLLARKFRRVPPPPPPRDSYRVSSLLAFDAV